MKSYVVYIHRRVCDLRPFYVGKGLISRAYNFIDRGEYWKRTASKYGVVVDIVHYGLQEWYALELEKELIAYYGRKDLGYGPLVNFTDGGEGLSGFRHSEKSRSKMLDGAIKARDNMLGVHALSAEEKVEICKKGGESNAKNLTGFCGRSRSKMSEDGRKGGLISGKERAATLNSTLSTCCCGKTFNVGNLARHRKTCSAYLWEVKFK